MKKITYSIDHRIFSMVPTYTRVILVLKNLQNSPTNTPLIEALRKAEAELRSSFTLETLLADKRIAQWQVNYRKFGMNPRDFRPAHEALSRRVVQGKDLPSINTAVDIGNIASITHLMPIGVHPLDQVECSLELRLATGTEHFVAFGQTEIEYPQSGEVILAEGDQVYTRAWVWRQSANSITTEDTKTLVINIDGYTDIDGQNLDALLEITRKLSEQMKEACGSRAEIFVLDALHHKVEFEV